MKGIDKVSVRIWVYVESADSRASDGSLAVLEAVRRLASGDGTAVEAVVVGQDVAEVATAAGKHGADTVRTVTGPEYGSYDTRVFAHALDQLVARYEPDALLFAGTVRGAELAPRVAARRAAGYVSECTGLAVDAGGRLTLTRSGLGGNLITTCVIPDGLQVATVRTGVFKAGQPVDASPDVVQEAVTAPAVDRRVELLEYVPSTDASKAQLEDADIVVSGGRAMGNAENFAILEDLASALGPTAAVGSSRPPADSGWVPSQIEIGISGKKISPALYIACGISGASQHLAGMSSSKTIVAINSDPDAPIFDVADLGVVGDLFEIVPALTAAVRRRRES